MSTRNFNGKPPPSPLQRGKRRIAGQHRCQPDQGTGIRRMRSRVSPAARRPSSRETGKRRLPTQGLPPQTLGSTVIRSEISATCTSRKVGEALKSHSIVTHERGPDAGGPAPDRRRRPSARGRPRSPIGTRPAPPDPTWRFGAAWTSQDSAGRSARRHGRDACPWRRRFQSAAGEGSPVRDVPARPPGVPFQHEPAIARRPGDPGPRRPPARNGSRTARTPADRLSRAGPVKVPRFGNPCPLPAVRRLRPRSGRSLRRGPRSCGRLRSLPSRPDPPVPASPVPPSGTAATGERSGMPRRPGPYSSGPCVTTMVRVAQSRAGRTARSRTAAAPPADRRGRCGPARPAAPRARSPERLGCPPAGRRRTRQ